MAEIRSELVSELNLHIVNEPTQTQEKNASKIALEKETKEIL